MDMNFYMPVNMIFGKDCIKNNMSLFAKYGKKCLIVTGKNGAKKSGALDDVITALNSNNIEFEGFDKIEQNPLYTTCKDASDVAKEFGAEFIIGIGGGSPLDAAKAIAVLSACKDTSADALYNCKWDGTPLPIIEVGTTAGTGSEVTPVSVITTPEGQKKSFRAPTTYPALSFGDATYTMSLSPEFTRSTALDALSHCMESYFNKTANEISKTFALRGVAILLEMLTKTANCESTPLTFDDREKLYCASLYGGLAIGVTGTAFPHALGYFLSESHGICHGNACAVYLEEFTEHNIINAPNEAESFFKALGTDKDTLLELIKINLPEIKVTISDEEFNELAPRFENNKSLIKSLGNVGRSFAEEILKKKFM